MTIAFAQFSTNIEEVRKTHLIATSISVPTGSILDTSNILRSCVVLGVSAIDHLIHELTITGMKEVFNGTRPVTPRYSNYQMSLAVINAIASRSPDTIFESEIRKSLGWQTFQRPEKIKDAISLFKTIPLWQQVAETMGEREINIRNQLDLIVDRRNMIAHEADIEPVFRTKRSISDGDVTNIVDFIERVGRAIYSVVR